MTREREWMRNRGEQRPRRINRISGPARAALLCLAIGPAGQALAQPQASLRIVDTAAPPGGTAIVVIELTEPQPISQGQLCLAFNPLVLSPPSKAAVFRNGNVKSQVTAASGTVLFQFQSSDASFGTDPDVPIAILAFPVDPSAQPGTTFEIAFDSITEFLDPQGLPYAQDDKPGVFTVGGFSIDDMTPSSGSLQAGDKIAFSGSGLPPSLRIDINGAQGDTTIVNPSLAEVTLQGNLTILESTRLRFRDQDNQDLPEIFVYPLIFSPPPLLRFALPGFTLIRGTAETVQLDLTGPSPPGSMLELSAEPAGILDVPDPIAVSPAEMSLKLPIFAKETGNAVLTAAVGNETATLAVEAVPGAVVEIPILKDRPDALTGLAITNPGSQPATIQARAFAQGEDAVDLNAAIAFDLNLPASSQQSRLLEEFDPALKNFQGWIELRSTNVDAASMFLNLTSGTGGFAGSSSSPKSTAFLFPQSRVPADGDFIFALVNNNGKAAQVDLRWRTSAGVILERQRVLPPQQSLIGSVLETFPEASPQQVASGYLEVRSTQPLSAYQQRKTAAHLLGQRPPSVASAASALFLPQAVSGPDWFTEITLINPNDLEAEAELRLISDPTAPIANFAAVTSITIVLQPHEELIARVADLFTLAPPDVRPGALRIGSSLPLVGAAVIGRDAASGPTAAVPLTADALVEGVSSQAASGAFQEFVLFTGLAFQNPAQTPVQVTVQAFAPTGVLLGQGDIDLPADARRSLLLDEMIEDLPAFAGGYLILKAGTPVFMLQIFGDSQLHFLSTVEVTPR